MTYTVLVVDDEPIERMALVQMIKSDFPGRVAVYSAANGMEMLRFLEKKPVHIAIVDINMPGLSGIETLRRLRQSQGRNGTRVIIYTAYSNFQYAVDAIKLEVDDYLVKPLKREKLQGALWNCIEKLEQEHHAKRQKKNMLATLKPAIADSLLQAVESDQIDRKSWGVYMDAMEIQPGQMAIVLVWVDSWSDMDRVSRKKYVKLLTNLLSEKYTCIASNHADHGVMLLLLQQADAHTERFSERLSDTMNAICARMTAQTSLNAKVGVGFTVDDIQQLHSSFLQAQNVVGRMQTVQMQKDGNASDRAYPDYRRQGVMPQSRVIIHAYAIVRGGYKEDITLESVADQVGVSASYLSRLFKEEMGIGFQDFLTNTRIEKAIELLRDAPISIRDLADAVGYNNPTYFCKAFKRKTGKTVGAFRESLELMDTKKGDDL